MTNHKGIILAGGLATRLMPITASISKQLLPIYDKPMIYYSLNILLKSKIREIAIITKPKDQEQFYNLLGNGSQFGCQFTYINQSQPKGIAESYILCEQFIGKSSSVLILGDNLFYGNKFEQIVIKSLNSKKGATIFGYEVNDPSIYGNIEINNLNQIVDIIEKPRKPKSSYAVTGLYVLDNTSINKAKTLKPSKRGELEITSLLKIYMKEKSLNLNILDRGVAWLDTGTIEAFNDANNFIKTIQKRQGIIVGCLEETAYENKWINKNQIKKNYDLIKNSEYGKYLKKILNKKN